MWEVPRWNYTQNCLLRLRFDVITLWRIQRTHWHLIVIKLHFIISNWPPIPMAPRSKVWVCGCLLSGIGGFESRWGHRCELCVVRKRSVRRAVRSSRGVLPTVVMESRYWGDLSSVGTVVPWKIKNIKLTHFQCWPHGNFSLAVFKGFFCSWHTFHCGGGGLIVKCNSTCFFFLSFTSMSFHVNCHPYDQIMSPVDLETYTRTMYVFVCCAWNAGVVHGTQEEINYGVAK